MAKPLRRAGLISAALAGAWLALELVWQPVSPPPLPPQDAPLPEQPALPDLTVEQPLLAEFKSTLERPLFSQERRPEEAVDDEEAGLATPVEPTDAPALRLTAVIVDAEGRSALLEQPGEAQGLRMREGDTIVGWRLESVADDRVVLSAGEKRSELLLRTFDAPAAPAAEPTPRVRNPIVPRRPVTGHPARRVPTPTRVPLTPPQPDLAPDG